MSSTCKCSPVSESSLPRDTSLVRLPWRRTKTPSVLLPGRTLLLSCLALHLTMLLVLWSCAEQCCAVLCFSRRRSPHFALGLHRPGNSTPYPSTGAMRHEQHFAV